jgi:hypothetical protein
VEHAETLRTIAEVATAFAGFSGVVVVLGHRAQREWTYRDTMAIGMLLLSSLGVVFFAFIPLLIDAAGVPVWRVSNGLLGAYHLLFLIWSVNHIRARKVELLIPRSLFHPGTAVGLASIALNALVAVGLFQSLTFFAYLAGLLWLLVIAVTCFAGLLFESRAA